MRAWWTAPALLARLPASAAYTDFVGTITAVEPLVHPETAERIARDTVRPLAHRPVVQRAPHPHDFFETVDTPPSAHRMALYERASAMITSREFASRRRRRYGAAA